MMVHQGLLLLRSPSSSSLPLSPWRPIPFISLHCIHERGNRGIRNSAALELVDGEKLTARERRQLRNEKREDKATNWREAVEDKLLDKPKKKNISWREKLNLDNLAQLGPQWWILRVSRSSGQGTAEGLARMLARHYPNTEFKIYAPTVRVKAKLKNGSISEKLNPLYPGCVFLRCVLNRDLHVRIRDCRGVSGFIGFKVGNTKKQIMRPKPVSSHDMEAIFQQAKKEQQRTDQMFEDEQLEAHINSCPDSNDVTESVTNSKQKRRPRKGIAPPTTKSLAGKDNRFLVLGSSVRVLSGPFSDFTGNIRKLNHKSGKVTVGFMLLGKESLVSLEVNQIVAEPSTDI